MKPMTVIPRRWEVREDLQLRWEATWAEPHMREGLAALIEMGLPTPTPAFDTTTHAIMNALREGYYLALNNISLLNPQVKPERTPQKKQFEHIRERAVQAQKDKK